MGSYTNLGQKNKFYKFSDFFDPNRDSENHIYVKVVAGSLEIARRAYQRDLPKGFGRYWEDIGKILRRP